MAVQADSQDMVPEAAEQLFQVAGRRSPAGEAGKIVMHGGYQWW